MILKFNNKPKNEEDYEMNCLDRVFNCKKPMIAMAHFKALPGRCGYDSSGGMKKIVESLKYDVDSLQCGGVDSIMFCNEGDLPYAFKMNPAAVAAMAASIGELKKYISVPFGVNMLWDPVASLAVAHATGAKFVREVFTGAYESDMGIFNSNGAEAFDFRKNIGGSEIAIFNNICPEFSRTLAGRSIGERAKIAEYFRVDAILISGPAAGSPTNMEDLIQASSSVQHTPVIANTGVRLETVEKILEIADGIIVGTALKVDGDTWNPVDPERVKIMVEKVKEIRSRR